MINNWHIILKNDTEVSFKDETIEFTLMHVITECVLIACMENIIKHVKERYQQLKCWKVWLRCPFSFSNIWLNESKRWE